MVVNLKLSNKSKKIIINTNNKKLLEKAIHKGFLNSRQLLFDTVRKNTKKEAPSKPGTSWSNRTGKATGGLNMKYGKLSAKFGNDVKYVKFLEEGTNIMIKRPSMWIALNKNKTNIQKNLEVKISEFMGV